VVIVATVRALKMHGGVFDFTPGRKVDKNLMNKPNVEGVIRGCGNLEKMIENMKLFGIPVVVAINNFETDTDKEIEAIRNSSIKAGAEDAVVSRVWHDGGNGGLELAGAVARAAGKKSKFRFLYPVDWPIKKKIEEIATKIYGAEGVDYTPEAESKIEMYTRQGFNRLPVCMAKTHLSLSHDPALKGRPQGFRVPVRDVRDYVGAGFLYPLLGTMRTMPGLPAAPPEAEIDIDEEGNIKGLF